MSSPESKNGAGEVPPALIRRADGRYLTPEWVAIAPQLDVSHYDNKPLVDQYQLLDAHAIINSGEVRDFEAVSYAPEIGHDLEGFRRNVSTHIGLYFRLGGMHQMSDERVGSFKLLEESLNVAIDQELKGVSPYQKEGTHWPRRLRANITEELGVYTKDVETLKKSMEDNNIISSNKAISWINPYKIHAVFSKYDVADQLHTEEGLNRQLNIPESIDEIQEGFYNDLHSVTDKILRLYDRNHDIKPYMSDAVGTITELVMLGHIRSTIYDSDSNGASNSVYARQAYLHEDHGLMLEIEEHKIGMPRSGFDLAVIDRDSEDIMKLEIKKRKKKAHTNVSNMPDVSFYRLYPKKRNRNNIGFLRDTRRAAAALSRYWRDPNTPVTDSEYEHIAKLYEHLDFQEQLDKYRVRVGKQVLEVM